MILKAEIKIQEEITMLRASQLFIEYLRDWVWPTIWIWTWKHFWRVSEAFIPFPISTQPFVWLPDVTHCAVNCFERLLWFAMKRKWSSECGFISGENTKSKCGFYCVCLSRWVIEYSRKLRDATLFSRAIFQPSALHFLALVFGQTNYVKALKAHLN